jgi:type IV pilus assembly protein PilA
MNNVDMKEKGFSLIELLIVVAIILIIAAIAIPNLLRSRMAANEASAVGSIRTMNTAAISFSSTYGDGFPPDITSIGTTGAAAVGCKNAQLIDSVLTAGTKSGYTFQVLPGTVAVTTTPANCTTGFSDGYGVIATPVTVGTTGQRSFCSDASGVIRYDATGAVFTLTGASTCSAGTGVLGQ